MPQFRKMTIGEVSEIAGDPKETIRARINRGLSPQRKSHGWARFDVPSTVQIAVHAEMLRRTDNHQIAIKAANFVAESLANFCNYPPNLVNRTGQLAGNYLIFRHHDAGPWTYTWCRDQEDALKKAGEYIHDTGICIEATGFYFLNVSTLTNWALDRIFDLQGIDGNVAEAPQ